jgi:hypothetical protein
MPKVGITRVYCTISGKSFFIAGAIGGDAVAILVTSPVRAVEVVIR